MDEWVANGCKLAWLINPQERSIDVYYQGEIRTILFHESLSGQDVLIGFEIKLGSIFK